MARQYQTVDGVVAAPSTAVDYQSVGGVEVVFSANLLKDVFDAVTIQDSANSLNKATPVEAGTVAEFVKVVLSPALHPFETLTVIDRPTLLDTVSKSDPVTVAEQVFTRTATAKTVHDDATVAEHVSLLQNPAILVHDNITIADLALLPLWTSRGERMLVTDVVIIRPNKLVVLAVESISAAESRFYPATTGTGGVGVGPVQVNTDADYTDYWVTGP